MSRPNAVKQVVAVLVACATLLTAGPAAQEEKPSPGRADAAPAAPDPPRLAALKTEAIAAVEARAVFTQQVVDSIFSFGELGFQEVETSRYLTDILRTHGFTVQQGVAGMPTAWVATWGSGKPVIALGSDIDAIPQASQRPGVAYHSPLVEGAPGHGEGHNSGQAVNITAALAVKALMEREKLPGTLRIWPGVAEELVAAKAWFIREGLFEDADIVLFSHVGRNLATSWGQPQGTGLVSVEYRFTGETAHSAGAPWRGRSALDAVELMNIGWNYRREHLRLQHRSHYVITAGGDQPNVVPRSATVWYYFRETDYARIRELRDLGNQIAEGAAKMTGTTWTSRILGTGWPQHMNKVVAETMFRNIRAVGLPAWSDADQALAKAVQRELKVPEKGLATELDKLGEPIKDEDNRGGGSDDIGDISWNVPTATLRYPSNIPDLPGHNWADAIAMATPIAHKGATAGAKVMAATMLDFLLRPELVEQAWDYFRNVQTKDQTYVPFLTADDPPATWMNREVMEKYRPEMQKYYYDPSKYRTYLEQLGIEYPTLEKSKTEN
jgi:aminobenzoyl-glutamate utilization protein B